MPWSYKRGNTPMESKVRFIAGSSRYCRVLAASRLYLDNFAHVKSFWIMVGPKLAQLSLHFGVDDIDGTVVEEKIYHDAGATTSQSLRRAELLQLIRRAGREPDGARALYLYSNGVDTLYRIHGTNDPASMGTRASMGCVRMLNEEVVEVARIAWKGMTVVTAE